MAQKSMTALVSAFARAYHTENNETKIFHDSVARRLLADEEYGRIAGSMAGGIGFFNPSFAGTAEAALRWVVDNQLSPTPLGRGAFAEKALEAAVSKGTEQYLVLGAGYDTFACRQPSWAGKLQIFEIDQPATAMDKRERLAKAGVAIPDNVHYITADFAQENWQAALVRDSAFDGGRTSFCSLLGVVYYLSRQTFEGMLRVLSSILAKGSAIALDYPDENSFTEKAGERAKKQAMMAQATSERMLAGYSYLDMEQVLSAYGFLIREHLTPVEITRQYFEAYNLANSSNKMTAFDNVNYCLAVKD